MKNSKFVWMMLFVAALMISSGSSVYAHCGMCGTDEAHAEESSIDGHAHDAEGAVKEAKDEMKSHM